MAARKRKQSTSPQPVAQLELFAADGAHNSPRVYLASQLTRLAQVFGEELYSAQRHDFFHQSPAIWVPNRNVRRWLQMQLARERGFAVHLNFQFLEEGLWSILESLDPAGERPLRLDRTDLDYLVLSALREMDAPDSASQQAKEWAPLRGYLGARPDARRLFQLAGRLSGLFQDYEYHRERQAAAWLEQPAICLDGSGEWGASDAPDASRAMLAAQRALYRRVNGVGPERSDGLLRELDRFGERALSLAGYARSVLLERAGELSENAEHRPRVHIFAMAQMSAFHLGLIDRLSAFIDFRVYLPAIPEHWRAATGAAPQSPNPPADSGWCQVAAPPANSVNDLRASVDARAGGGDMGPARLNALWGRPAGEMLALLTGSQTPREFFWDAGDLQRSAFQRANPHALLSRLQRELAYGTDPEAADHSTNASDASVQITGCPGLRREAETIYQSILFQMDRDPELLLTDIAILVPDMQLYRPVLQAVFDGDLRGDGRPRVPYNLSDFSSGDASVYAAGVGALLTLAESQFSRRDLFALFLNPCFLSAHRLEREEALAWLSWADQLQINSDLSDRRSWQRALRRLRLGGILETPEREDDFRHFAEYVPFSDLSASDPEILDRFGSCYLDLSLTLRGIRQSMQATQGAENQQGTLQALDRLRELMERHLKPPEDRPGELIVRGEMMHSMDRLGRHLSRGEQAAPGYELLREILLGQLGGVPGNRGNYLAGGVTIAALQPIRPIPFRVLYLPGMGAGEFPGHADQSILNLRNLERQPGDATLPESNRALLLENLLSVRDRLYISYVNRDIQRDAEFHLCSPITELKSALLELAPDFTESQVPLQMADERHLRFSIAGARGATPPDHDALASYARPERIFAMQRLLFESGERLAPAERAALSEQIAKARGQAGDASHADAPSRTTQSADLNSELRFALLSDFLIDPLSTQLRGRLGLYDLNRGTEAVLDEDELFYWPPRRRSRFLSRALELMIRGTGNYAATAPESGFAELIGDAQRQDELPPPGFAELETTALQTQYSARLAQWQSFAADLIPLPDLRFGAGSARHIRNANASMLLRLPVAKPGGLQLHADLRRLYLQPGEGGPVLVQVALRSGKKAGPAQLLPGFLDLLLLRALSDDADFLQSLAHTRADHGAAISRAEFEQALASPGQAIVLAREEQRAVRVDLSPQAAREYLQFLAAEFSANEFVDLPLNLLEDRRLSRRPHQEADLPAADSSYAEELLALCEDYGDDRYQMELVRLLPRQYSPDTARTVHRRLRPFFACYEAAASGGRS